MSRMSLLSKSLLTLLLAVSSAAQAQFSFEVGHGPSEWGTDGGWRGEETTKTYVIELDGEIFRGQGQKIRLKQELLAAHPRIRNLDEAKIESIVLRAKSRRGMGSAELLIANRSTDRQGVAEARRGTFEDFSSRSYNSVDLYVPRRQQPGAWVLVLDGTIKVESIEITLKQTGDRPDPRPRVEILELGNLNIDVPVLPSSQSFQVGELVKSIKVRSAQSAIQILDVTVEYENRRRVSLPEFNVFLFPGQEIEIDQNSREKVRRIWVTASSIRANAKLKVSAAIQRRN